MYDFILHILLHTYFNIKNIYIKFHILRIVTKLKKKLDNIKIDKKNNFLITIERKRFLCINAPIKNINIYLKEIFL